MGVVDADESALGTRFHDVRRAECLNDRLLSFVGDRTSENFIIYDE